MSCEWHVATSAQPHGHDAFGVETATRVRTLQAREHLGQAGIAFAALDPDDSLAGGGEREVGGDTLTDACLES